MVSRQPRQPRQPSGLPPPPSPLETSNSGPMGSFSGLRNWIFGAIAALVVFLGGAFIQNNSAAISRLEIKQEALRDKHEKDLNELRERWNLEYQNILTTQGQNGERLGRLETELHTQHQDLVARLDRIEAKLH